METGDTAPQTVLPCVEGDVRMVPLPAVAKDTRRGLQSSGVGADTPVAAEIHYDGYWYPICGEGFVDDGTFGVDIFCQMLGYTSGAIEQVGAFKLPEVAMAVGQCVRVWDDVSG